MKKMSVLAAALALGLGFSAVAQAQPHHDRRDDRRGPPPHAQAHGHHKHDDRRNARDWDRNDHRHDRRDARDHRRDDRRDARDHRRGAGPDHRWVKGYRVPPQYRSQQYVVHDWRGHHLSAPPRGYQWVQYGGDYMMVAIASGVITQLVINGMR